jgi:hypothetical protein
MKTALEKLRTHPKVLDIDDERAIGNGIIVHLRYGWTNDPMGGCHTFAEDTPTSALKYIRRALSRCHCDQCSKEEKHS